MFGAHRRPGALPDKKRFCGGRDLFVLQGIILGHFKKEKKSGLDPKTEFSLSTPPGPLRGGLDRRLGVLPDPEGIYFDPRKSVQVILRVMPIFLTPMDGRTDGRTH
jgi:hypothetical protein